MSDQPSSLLYLVRHGGRGENDCMNALVTFRIADARKAVSSTDDVRQAAGRQRSRFE